MVPYRKAGRVGRLRKDDRADEGSRSSRGFDGSWQILGRYRTSTKTPEAGQRVRQTPGAPLVLVIWFSFLAQKTFPFGGQARRLFPLESQRLSASISRYPRYSFSLLLPTAGQSLYFHPTLHSPTLLSSFLLLELQIIPAINDEPEACTNLPRRIERQRIRS